IDTLISLKDTPLIEKVIEICCLIKSSIVAEDERDRGMRRILNYGHTIGHALEAAFNFETFRHGEAVVLGMLGSSWISREKGLISEEDFNRIELLLKNVQMPEVERLPSPSRIIEKVAFDKKISDGKLNFVLLNKIGNAFICEELSNEQIQSAVEYILEKFKFFKTLSKY
ncbi:MAG: hypothetical protein ACE5QV_02575, partial [Fidelibacterota bacterium]